jgi:hypothetical protein
MSRAFAVLTLVATAALCGCGYHIAGHNDALPKTIHVIAVPALENKTTSYRIEQRLTAAHYSPIPCLHALQNRLDRHWGRRRLAR